MTRLAIEAAYFGAVQDGVESQQELIESLRQQLADLLEANRIMCEDFAAENSKCAELEQQLAAALAALKSKDKALQSLVSSGELSSSDCDTHQLYCEVKRTEVKKGRKALAIQPDDAALKAWFGEQPCWTHSCDVLCLDNVELWIDRCPHCGKPAPKGMKCKTSNDA